MRTRFGSVFAGLLIAGCGGSGHPAPAPVAGAAKQAAAVVKRLEQATARHDFATICDDLFAAGTRERAGGSHCAELLAARARGIRHPRIAITAIELNRNTAKVKVTTTAAGQAPVAAVIRLVRENGSYRVSSLAG